MADPEEQQEESSGAGSWIAAAATAVITIFTSLYEDEKRDDQAEVQIESIEKQLALINEQKGEYESSFAAQGRNIYDMAGNRIELLGNKIGLGFRENLFKTESESSKSGLAFSGTVERRSDIAKDTLSESFRSGKQSVIDDREQALSTMNLEKTKLLNTLELKEADLEAQKAFYEEELDD